MKHLLNILCFLCIPLMGSGQDTNNLPSVTITDNRIESSVMESGRNVQVIGRAQIEALPVQNLNELLQYVSGLDFRQRGAFGAQADAGLRGGTFDQCLILLNGIKMNDPQTGHHNMNLGIPIEAIRRVEIIKGPAAARYGLNAFSGVINIITAPEETAGVRVGMQAGQLAEALNSEVQYGAMGFNASLNFGEKMKHMVHTDHRQSSGYRPNTEMQRTAMLYQSLVSTGFGDFNLLASGVSNDFGASGYYAFPIDSTSKESVNTYVFSLRHNVKLGAFAINTRAYSRKNFDEYTLFRAAPHVYQNQHRTDVEGGEVHASYEHKFGVTGLGVEYRSEAINSSNLGTWRRSNAGLFAEHKAWFLNKRLSVNAGAYLNASEDFGVQVLPSVEAGFRLLEYLSMFGNAGQTFRTPTYTDLYYQGPMNIGNPSLSPESATGYEAGFKFNRQGNFLQASAFLLQANDLIDWTRLNELSPWKTVNYTSVNTQGIELVYERFMRVKIARSRFEISRVHIAYDWIEMQNESEGEFISRYALTNLRHQGVMQLVLAYDERFSLAATFRIQDRVNHGTYSLADLRFAYRTPAAVFSIDCTNLLATRYTEIANAPMPGRWIRAGLDVQLHRGH